MKRLSVMVQMVKNLPAVQKTWIQSLGQEELSEKEMQPTPVFLPGNLMDRGAWWATAHGVSKTHKLSN